MTPTFSNFVRCLALAAAALPALAAGSKYMVFTNYLNGTLSRYTFGGALEDPWIKPQGAENPAGIATDGTNVYWVDNGAGAKTLCKAALNHAVDLTGTTDYAIKTFPNQIRGLGIDASAGYLFVCEYTDKKITAVKISDQTTSVVLDTTVISGTTIPGACRVDVTNKLVYWTTHTGEVYKTPFDYTGVGGAPVASGGSTLVATGFVNDSLWDISITGGKPYVMVFDAGYGNDGIRDISGGGLGTLVNTDQGSGKLIGTGMALKADGTNFYYADHSGPSGATVISVVPVAGGDAATVAELSTLSDTMIGGITIIDFSTVVTLTSFNATAANGKVSVAWTTGSEVDTAGFNVLRATALAGPYAKVNAALIPATGTNVAGASYTWTDAAVAAGTTYYYKLEDVDTKGGSTFHGPVSALAANSAIASFQATPASIFAGGGSLLSWTLNGASALLDGAAVTGTSQWVAPAATKTYTLAAGADSAVTTVTVKTFGMDDIAGLSKAWGHRKGEAAYDPSYDLNGDGIVDDADVALCFKGL